MLAEGQQYTELLDKAEKKWSSSQEPAVLPLWAMGCAQTGDLKKAEALFQQAVTYQADFDDDALCDLAAVLIMMQRVDEAKTILVGILERQPVHDLVLARLGYCCLLSDDLVNAQIYFSQSLVFTPERFAVHLSLISLSIGQKSLDKALQQLDKALYVLEQRHAVLTDAVYQLYWLQLNTLQLKVWVLNEQYSPAEAWLNTLHQQQQAGGCEEDLFVHCLQQYGRLLAERDRHLQATDILSEYSQYYPENSELALSLAELLKIQGYWMQAVNVLQKVLESDKDRIELWIELAQVSLHRQNKLARKAAEKAIELSECQDTEQALEQAKYQTAQAKNALAQVENQEGNFDAADLIYRELLAENNRFLPALMGLGQQQMQRGNIDEALELFERVKEIDPLRGHSALINARRFPDDVDVLEKMALSAQTPSLEGSLRTSIFFQLASAWEKRKDYDKAFSFARQANEASRRLLAYDAKKHRNYCARIRTAFSKSLYQHRVHCGVSSSLPVYVVGMPRSGTTLIEQIISGHSDIFGAGELGLVPRIAQGLSRWERHTGSGRSYPDCVDDLTPGVAQGIANNLLKELREFSPEAKHIVDKLPHNFENIGLIKFLFPQAKIISVRRDPRDIALSNYFTDFQAKHGGMGFAYDLETIGEQLADHNLLMDYWHKLFPGEILELNYEDVVEDLEGSARTMLEYIGVEWQPEVLKFNELERTVRTASVWQVRQPIYKSSKEKWKRYSQYLAPLIKGTNAPILPDPIDDMMTLPEPGFLTDGVAFYKDGKLDEAETCFKKMLHHNPEHGACNYMLGLVYLSKKHLQDGISLIEKALDIAPWHKEWRDNLIKAYELVGDSEKIAELDSRLSGHKDLALKSGNTSEAALL